jgi:hypothetical protein
MKICYRKNRKAFSLVEMIAASIILSGGVVALCVLNTASFTSVRANRELEIAWTMLDRQLTVIDYMGLDEFLELRQFSGQIGPTESNSTVYYWNAELTEGSSDNLYMVELTVSWGRPGRVRTISASTVLNGIDDMLIEEQTQEEETETA